MTEWQMNCGNDLAEGKEDWVETDVTCLAILGPKTNELSGMLKVFLLVLYRLPVV